MTVFIVSHRATHLPLEIDYIPSDCEVSELFAVGVFIVTFIMFLSNCLKGDKISFGIHRFFRIINKKYLIKYEIIIAVEYEYFRSRV